MLYSRQAHLFALRLLRESGEIPAYQLFLVLEYSIEVFLEVRIRQASRENTALHKSRQIP